jgi:hypothetical protein
VPGCGRVRSSTEAKKHIARRRKRKRDKIAKLGAADDGAPAGAEGSGELQDTEGLTVADELVPFQVGPSTYLPSAL